MMLMYAYTSIMVFGASLRFGFVLLRNGLSIFQFYALNISSNSFPNNGEPHYGIDVPFCLWSLANNRGFCVAFLLPQRR